MLKINEFKFKTEPFTHQMQALSDSWDKDYYALLMEMGTGKTKVALDTISMLYEDNKINACLVVAPKGVYDNWIRGEIPTHVPDRIERTVLRWIPSTSKKYQTELKDFINENFKIIPARITGTKAHYQRQLGGAVERARYLALLPYTDLH